MSCQSTEASSISFVGTHYYEHDNGQMIFAIITAENEKDARLKATEIKNNIEFAYKGANNFPSGK